MKVERGGRGEDEGEIHILKVLKIPLRWEERDICTAENCCCGETMPPESPNI